MKTLHSASTPRRSRPAAPRCRNGVSSLLRLTQPSTPRLPQPRALADWIGRAASAMA